MFEFNNYLEFERDFENLVTKEFNTLYSEHKYQELSAQFFKILDFYNTLSYINLSEDDYHKLNIFIENS